MSGVKRKRKKADCTLQASKTKRSFTGTTKSRNQRGKAGGARV